MKKIISVSLIILLFLMFSLYELVQHSGMTVIKILSPSMVVVDLNRDNIADDNEIICIPEIKSFTSNISVNQNVLIEKLNIPQSAGIAIGYLSDEFAQNTLLNRKVKLKFAKERTPDCRIAEIYLGKEKYSDKLKHSGFGIENGKPVSAELFRKNLEIAKKLNLVILNKKSGKYHTLDCKYGLKSSDFLVLPLEEALHFERCKYCFLKKKTHTNTKEYLPPISSYPEMLRLKNIKFIVSDYANIQKPDRNCTHRFCKEFVSLINSTNSTLDIAMYGWDNIPKVQNALDKAKARNVKIRVVYDETTREHFYPETIAFAKSIELSRSDENENSKTATNLLMHNKFAISDNKRLLTGSMNFSNTGLSGFNGNSVVIFDSEALAKIYSDEFEQMFSGKFHNLKTKHESPDIVIADTKIKAYFSPQDKTITNAILPLVNSARKYIYIPTFIMTHKDLTAALISAKARGVDVRIILDATSTRTRNSTHETLRANRLLLKTENYAGKMHSKSIIIDDKYVILGSMNFSNSGENKNDENCLIIENSEIASFYRGYFEYMWKKIPDFWLTHSASAESKYSIGSCNDGVDNDFDGKIDSADDGCKQKSRK